MSNLKVSSFSPPLIPIRENLEALGTQIFLGPWLLVTFDFSSQALFDLEVETFWDPFLREQILLMCPPLPQKFQMVDELSLVDSLTK